MTSDRTGNARKSPDFTPASEEVAEAKQRALSIAVGAALFSLLPLAVGLLAHDRWIRGLAFGILIGLIFIQHSAIKVARLLGYRRPS